METETRWDLTVRRNDDVWERPLRVIGPNLTGVDMRAQIRLTGDTPGAPLADLPLVTNGNAEGVRLAGAPQQQANGAWLNDVRFRLNKSTRQALPYSGEIGEGATFEWGFLIAGVTRIQGKVNVPPQVYGSDNAPLSRPPSYGSSFASTASFDAGASLMISQDGGAQLIIDGADLVGRIEAGARNSAERAEAALLATQGLANPLAGLSQAARSPVNGLTPAAEALDFVDIDGRVLFALGGGGLPRESAGFASALGAMAGANNTLAGIAALPRHGRSFPALDWWGMTIAGQSNAASQSGSVLPAPPSLGNKRLGELDTPDGKQIALVDLVETENESCATDAANHATDALRKALPPWATYPQQWVVFNMGSPGAAFSDIKKGSNAYNVGLAAVQQRRDLAVAAGKTYAERALIFIHGESDSNAGRSQAAYYADLIQYKNDWNADVAAITGQTERIPIFIAQLALGDGFSTTSGPALAMLQAAESDPDCFIIAAEYAFTYGPDGLHLTSHDQRRLGEYVGKALHRFYIQGKSPSTLRPRSCKLVDARNIDVEFEDPPVPPLVLDIDQVWPGDAGMGFAIYDSSGPEIPVIGARVVRPNTVRITTGADVSLADRVTYAIKTYTRGQTGGLGAGRRKGARGCLRDSDLTPPLYQDAKGRPYPLHNWCAVFDKVLEVRA
jgi:hypothetical protein